MLYPVRGIGVMTLRKQQSHEIADQYSYDIIKEQLLDSGYFADSIPTHLLTAVLGGTISVTLVAPVDFVKSRIQASSTQHVSFRSRLSHLCHFAVHRSASRVQI